MDTEEGRIIRENPLRILGVYSDTPKKEIVANLGKLRAFSKTGKKLSFESDFTSLLGTVNRAVDSIEKAYNDIALPKDKLQFGMFWFMKHTDNDKIALDCLKRGDPNEAMSIIQKKGNYSGVVNMAVLALIMKRWDIALYSYAYLLESPSRRGALVKALTDSEVYYSEEDLAEFISSKLIQDFPNAHWLEQIRHENVELGEKIYPFKSRFENSKLLRTIESKSIAILKKDIDEALAKASSVSREDASANLSMAAMIEDKCKHSLWELRLELGKEDITYTKYADAIANQVLNHCINYYNHCNDNPNKAKDILKYLQFARRIAVGPSTVKRCRENLFFIKKECEKIPPQEIESYINSMKKTMDSYCGHNSIDLSGCLGKLEGDLHYIEKEVGAESVFYKEAASNIVFFIFGEIVDDINQKLESYKNSYLDKDFKLSSLKSTLTTYRSIVFYLSRYCLTEESQKYYNKNRNAFLSLYLKFNSFSSTSGISNAIPYIGKVEGQRIAADLNRDNSVSSKKKAGLDDKPTIVLLIALITVFLALVLSWVLGNNRNQQANNGTEYAQIDDDTLLVDTVAAEDFQNEDYLQNESSEYEVIWYKTGDRPFIDYYGKGKYDKSSHNVLKIKNGSTSDAVVFLETLSGNKVRHVYICQNESFKMIQIPGGKYIIKVLQGNEWNPDKYNGEGFPYGGFMRDVSMLKSNHSDPFDYPSSSSGQYGTYEITLYKVVNGNLQTETIDASEVF